MVTIYPEEGNFSAVAKALLAAASHPNQVRSVSHPRAGFEVPEDVFDRFQEEAEQSSTSDEAKAENPAAQTGTLKRRPGRPRKNAAPMGVTSKEE